MKFIVQLYICLFQYFEDFNSSVVYLTVISYTFTCFNISRTCSPNYYCPNRGSPVRDRPIGGRPEGLDLILQ